MCKGHSLHGIQVVGCSLLIPIVTGQHSHQSRLLALPCKGKGKRAAGTYSSYWKTLFTVVCSYCRWVISLASLYRHTANFSSRFWQGYSHTANLANHYVALSLSTTSTTSLFSSLQPQKSLAGGIKSSSCKNVMGESNTTERFGHMWAPKNTSGTWSRMYIFHSNGNISWSVIKHGSSPFFPLLL